jgi:hypothetical protein
MGKQKIGPKNSLKNQKKSYHQLGITLSPLTIIIAI